jgi:hypothetical protein
MRRGFPRRHWPAKPTLLVRELIHELFLQLLRCLHPGSDGKPPQIALDLPVNFPTVAAVAVADGSRQERVRHPHRDHRPVRRHPVHSASILAATVSVISRSRFRTARTILRAARVAAIVSPGSEEETENHPYSFTSSFLITHRMRLERAPEGYGMFVDKSDACVKVVLTP